jgi:glutamyl-tRNA reductase
MEDTCTIPVDQLLLPYAGEDAAACALFVTRTDASAVEHLMEVACGLHSQILHEEQIVTQVGHAVALARAVHATDALSDTLFRMAVSAGKDALTHVSVSSVPLSLSASAVHKLETTCGGLQGKTGVIIGNGKMGCLAAELLVQRGCKVFMTLRSDRHGASVVPCGTTPIPYEQRYEALNGADFGISATRSPHCTLTAAKMRSLPHPPAFLLDLAMPRDVEAACKEIPHMTCWNLDDFQEEAQPDSSAVEALHRIAEKYADDFLIWSNYRAAVPYIQQIKSLTQERLLRSTVLDAYREEENLREIVHVVTEKAIDMLMGGMKSGITPELLKECAEKIQDRLRK